MTDPIKQIRPEFLTVRELAELLRIKERKVYDLAATGAVPCSKVTGKLLFPEADIRAWIASAGTTRPTGHKVRAQVFVGSHDPLLDWALRQSRCGIPTYFDGSLDGLERFAEGQGIATGMHIFDAEQDMWNIPAVEARMAGQNVALIGFARRKRGLILRPGDAASVQGLGDLADMRLVPRQQESGSHALFEHLCSAAGVDPSALVYADAARSEADAVMAVQSGVADATFGLETLAEPYGLAFVPLVQEQFDLLVDRKAWFDGPMQQLLSFLHNPRFREHAAKLAGYDLSELGIVRWNA